MTLMARPHATCPTEIGRRYPNEQWMLEAKLIGYNVNDKDELQ